MQFRDKERVSDDVVIGRRVVRTRSGDTVIETVQERYIAEFIDPNTGRRRFQSLGTSIKRDARTKALRLCEELRNGHAVSPPSQISMVDLVARFRANAEARGLVSKSLAKYRAEEVKILTYCKERGLVRASQFGEEAYHQYGAWLRAQTHKQGTRYCPKTIYTSLTVLKSVLKFGWRMKLLPHYDLGSIPLPSSRPRPQPCFTYDEIQMLLAHTTGDTRDAIAVLFYTGMRVGELIQLRGESVLWEAGYLGKLHICRGGSADSPKDKDHRWIPIHPAIRDCLKARSKKGPLVFPGLKARTLLAKLKRACRELGMNPRLKVHSLRHAACSYWLAEGVSVATCLEWLGHGGSEILALYTHVHDRDSDNAMKALAERAGRAR